MLSERNNRGHDDATHTWKGRRHGAHLEHSLVAYLQPMVEKVPEFCKLFRSVLAPDA